MSSIPIELGLVMVCLFFIALVCIFAIGSKSLNEMQLSMSQRGVVLVVKKQKLRQIEQAKIQDETPVPPSLEL
jgi:hypothetical protein